MQLRFRVYNLGTLDLVSLLTNTGHGGAYNMGQLNPKPKINGRLGRGNRNPLKSSKSTD